MFSNCCATSKLKSQKADQNKKSENNKTSSKGKSNKQDKQLVKKEKSHGAKPPPKESKNKLFTVPQAGPSGLQDVKGRQEQPTKQGNKQACHKRKSVDTKLLPKEQLTKQGDEQASQKRKSKAIKPSPKEQLTKQMVEQVGQKMKSEGTKPSLKDLPTKQAVGKAGQRRQSEGTKPSRKEKPTKQGDEQASQKRKSKAIKPSPKEQLTKQMVEQVGQKMKSEGTKPSLKDLPTKQAVGKAGQRRQSEGTKPSRKEKPTKQGDEQASQKRKSEAIKPTPKEQLTKQMVEQVGQKMKSECTKPSVKDLPTKQAVGKAGQRRQSEGTKPSRKEQSTKQSIGQTNQRRQSEGIKSSANESPTKQAAGRICQKRKSEGVKPSPKEQPSKQTVEHDGQKTKYLATKSFPREQPSKQMDTKADQTKKSGDAKPPHKAEQPTKRDEQATQKSKSLEAKPSPKESKKEASKEPEAGPPGLQRDVKNKQGKQQLEQPIKEPQLFPSLAEQEGEEGRSIEQTVEERQLSAPEAQEDTNVSFILFNIGPKRGKTIDEPQLSAQEERKERQPIVQTVEKPQPSTLQKQQEGEERHTIEQSVEELQLPTQQEQEEDKEIVRTLSKFSLQARRPGKEGTKLSTVRVNYFPLNTETLNIAFHYDVAIEPDQPKRALVGVMETFRMKRYRNKNPAYDGSTNLYSPVPLFQSSEMSDTIEIKLDGEKRKYKVTVKLVSELDLTCLQPSATYAQDVNILCTNQSIAPLHCLNTILGSVPAIQHICIGRSYFTPPRVQFKLGNGCVLYHGFSQNAILRWKPFLNMDTAKRAFTECRTMVELLRDMFPNVHLDEELGDYETSRFETYIKNLKVFYEISEWRRKYKVNGLYASAKKATFNTAKGSTTVEEYFKDIKQIRIKYPNLPTLWVGNQHREDKILLPLEFCTLVPGQPVNRSMSDNQIRKMIEGVSVGTNNRLGVIERNIDYLQYDHHPVMKQFGLTVHTKLQEIDARVLQSPQLKYASGIQTVLKGCWTPGTFSEGIDVRYWTIFCLNKTTRDETLKELYVQLTDNASSLGLKLFQPVPPFVRVKRASDLPKLLGGQRYAFVVVVLNNKKDCYSEVKRISELSAGFITQCVKPSTLESMQKSIIYNLLLKINTKLNGRSHSIAGFPVMARQPTMMMGASVTHARTQNYPTIATVTASYDVHFFKYRFEWRLQPPRQHIIFDLESITMQHLRYYRLVNNCMPEILFYIRDGVSDEQFLEVLMAELKAIRAACLKLNSDYQPGIVFIIVQRNHHTRFFLKDPSISEDICNVPAGTCIDKLITHPSIVDFFLVSHTTAEGVARPTKYVKLWSDVDVSEDQLEQMMYYLCHVYARCNRSVSYPVPTYYAHLAAARIRTYCDRNIDINELKELQRKLTIHEKIYYASPMFFI